MKIRIEIPIEKYLKALEGKMLECKYFELVWLERKIQEKYEGLLNKYIFKKSYYEIVQSVMNEYRDDKYRYNKYHDASKHQFKKEKQLREYLQIKEFNQKPTISCDSETLDFIDRYDGIYMRVIRGEVERLEKVLN